MMGHARIYLDNAATSWPKPEGVYCAIDGYMRELGAPAGRSGYAEGVMVSRMVEQARVKVARFLGVQDPGCLLFTPGCTDSLNTVIHGLLREGDHAVVSAVEHNSVLRPLALLEAQGRIKLSRVPADSRGRVHLDAVRGALRAATRLVAIAHASNVTGVVQSVAEIAKVAHGAGALVLCDAAQTVGHVPVDMSELGVDFLAASGHKGLLGPLGIGILAMRSEAAQKVDSFRQGGTGTTSESVRQPDDLPYKFEAGSQNVPGILGLAAGVDYLSERGIESVEQHGIRLARLLIEALGETPGVTIWGQTAENVRLPLVSMALAGYEPQDVAAILDSVHHVQVRAGLHCAPAMHENLGTGASGGTVRFSPGAFTTVDEVEAAIGAVRELAASSELAQKA